jgi:hypothetical protein
VQKLRRPLDVRKKERDGPGRKLPHGQIIALCGAAAKVFSQTETCFALSRVRAPGLRPPQSSTVAR